MQRRLDNKGRITIPISLFRKLGFDDKQLVEITVEYGKICLKKFYKFCIQDIAFIGIVRPLDAYRRLNIPVDYLKILDIDLGYSFEVTFDEFEEKIVLS